MRYLSGAGNFFDRPHVCQSLANHSIAKYRSIEIRDDHGDFRILAAPGEVMVNIGGEGCVASVLVTLIVQWDGV